MLKTQGTFLRCLCLCSVLFLLSIGLLAIDTFACLQKTNKERKESIPILKMSTSLVTFNVTVTDTKGRYVVGLSKDHFEVYDDKVQQTIQQFNDEDSPISIGIIFDVSESMDGKIGCAFYALRKFCDTNHPLDQYFLVAFNNKATLVQDFTNNPNQVRSLPSLVIPKGRTALYDATYLGIEKVRTGKYPRKALLLISDGQDNNSRYSFNELKQLLKESYVQLYAIGIANGFSGDEVNLEGQVKLEELTRLTGGEAFFPNDDKELSEVITRIALELRHQYSIAYEPNATTNDSHWHKVKVRVKNPNGRTSLSIRTREGYLAK